MARTIWIKVALLLLAGLPAAADQLELLSKVPPRRASDTPSGDSWTPKLSADGRYAIFQSPAVNVVPGQVDGNRDTDVFLYDRVTEKVTLVSHAAGSPVTTADGQSLRPAISADGRWVAYVSTAQNLIPGQQDAPGDHFGHLYLWDRVTGATTLVDRSSRSPRTAANSLASGFALSADGRWIAFASFATDLVEGQADANGQFLDLFLFDRVTARTTLVSRAAGSRRRTGDGASDLPSISADGRYVAFRSQAKDLVPGVGGEARWNGFVYDRVADRNAWLGAVMGTWPSVRISANGEYVGVLRSRVPESVPPFPAGAPHLYLIHRPTGRAMLVSHASDAPSRLAAGIVLDFALSADASWVAFTSTARNHVPGQAAMAVPTDDVFLFERSSRQIRLVSRTLASPVEEAGRAALGGISADGRWIVFQSDSPAIADEEGGGFPGSDVFLHDRTSGENTLVSDPGDALNAGEPAISADGGWVAFTSFEMDLAGGKDLNASQDVFLYSRTTGEIELASRRGAPSATPQTINLHGNLSADGRYAVFTSGANNLVPRVSDTNNGFDVFLYDQVLKTTTLVSRSAASPRRAGNGYSEPAMISADGRFVAFYSQASDLVPGQVDTPPHHGSHALPPVPVSGLLDVFLFDRTTGTTTLVSRSTASPLTATNYAFPGNLDITPDGAWILFGNNGDGLFLYERASGTVTRISHGEAPTGPADVLANGALSADGRFAAFASGRPQRSVYLFDREAGSVTRIAFGTLPDLSADGRFLAFLGDTEASGSPGVFLHDRIAGTIQEVTSATETVDGFQQPFLSADGRYLVYTGFSVRIFDRTTGETRQAPIHSSFLPRISPNGRWVAFVAETAPLPSTVGGSTNVFRWDLTTGETVLVSRSNLPPHDRGDGESAYLPDVTDGGRVLFTSRAWNLVPGDFNQGSVPYISMADVFLYVP